MERVNQQLLVYAACRLYEALNIDPYIPHTECCHHCERACSTANFNVLLVCVSASVKHFDSPGVLIDIHR